MEVWRVPPLLIVQLKRFQYTQYSRRKLQNLVTFPVDNLDLAPFLARAKHAQPPPDVVAWEWLGGRRVSAPPPKSRTAKHMEALPTEESGGGAELEPISSVPSSADREVSGLPVLLSRDETSFDLYGVVNHYGVLGGGHYVSLMRWANKYVKTTMLSAQPGDQI